MVIGFGAVGYLWAYIMLRCFKPYLPEEDPNAHDESVLLHDIDEAEDDTSAETAEDEEAEELVDDEKASAKDSEAVAGGNADE